jgi:hypothetical protein
MSNHLDKSLSAGGGLQKVGIAAVLAFATLTAPLAGAQGMRVSRDPVTGEIRIPTAEENKALDDLQAAAAAKAAASGQIAPTTVTPVSVTHSDGSVEQKLDEQSMVYSVMVRNADGTMSMQCVTGQENANGIVFGKTPSVATRKGNLHE